ncbi:MAG TPA: cortex morphogenetic protein CmpA [Bacilli bacterium]|nr:cortex morphogenetic protein CmpA [Bacilli bacterium]
MPTWLRKQFKKAYFEKNYNEIKLLNQCWFYYLRKKQLIDVKKT